MNIINKEKTGKPKNRKRNMFKLLAEAGTFLSSLIAILAAIFYLIILGVLFKASNPTYANIVIGVLTGINLISIFALVYAAEKSAGQVKKAFVMLQADR
ncbi:hypothetical protein WOSG25_090330 [Weissella oryzae SG25]|uniref:Uncharacterized protein n=1 Tax=Weissella oryzae (strain DSM 25784 / JCM 18191 / LMG 30913 / SG25) TaxID=1329250 RepID=A0A069D1W2_WEIOS|nr:hypothetical protein [Weissella oryzae]GAK31336.1 hypothetical protein WOSG25_090330 [Weissella oryzae SG25]